MIADAVPLNNFEYRPTSSFSRARYERNISDCNLPLQQYPFCLRTASGGVNSEQASGFLVQRSGTAIEIISSNEYLKNEFVDKQSELSSINNTVDEISRNFNFNKTILAAVIKVSRKSLYNWLDGTSEPREESLNRILDLVLISRDWVNYGFPVDKMSLSMRIVGEQSILDMLSSNVLDRGLILHAGTTLYMQSEQPVLKDPFA